MSVPVRLPLPDPGATKRLGAMLSGHHGRLVVFLHGDLGSGKTTLVRGLLRALGHRGSVPSPTYTLVEPYSVCGRECLHLDLYRLGDPEELDYLGLRELLEGPVLVLVEWPERAGDGLPAPDVEILLEYEGDQRRATVFARSAVGGSVVENLDRDHIVQ